MTLNEALMILGLSRKFTGKDVKSAYRKKSLVAHPDKGGSATEFLKVREAYELLQSNRVVSKMGITHSTLFIIKEID